MLQEDWKKPLQIGGMLILQLMTPQHHHLAGIQELVQRATHTQRSGEAQEVRVPCSKVGSDVCK
jgi:hypothetical protein